MGAQTAAACFSQLPCQISIVLLQADHLQHIAGIASPAVVSSKSKGQIGMI